MPAATKTPSRRALFGAGAALIVGGAIATTANAAPAGADAELIRVCHRFAEAELESWYRYILAPDDVADEQDTPPEWHTYNWIVATPATTPEGWHAKALAYAAFDREAYNDHEDDRDGTTQLLAALLRDMVAPARNAIIARLAAEYGPLPSCYSPEGVWIGLSEEEKEALAAEQGARIAAWTAEREAATAEVLRRHSVETMTREELEKSIAGLEDMRDISEQARKRVLERLAEVVA